MSKEQIYKEIQRDEQKRIMLARLGLVKPQPKDTPIDNLKKVLG